MSREALIKAGITNLGAFLLARHGGRWDEARPRRGLGVVFAEGGNDKLKNPQDADFLAKNRAFRSNLFATQKVFPLQSLAHFV